MTFEEKMCIRDIGTVHKIQTVPEDDNMPCCVRAVPLPCVFLISVSFSFPAAAFALHQEIFLSV